MPKTYSIPVAGASIAANSTKTLAVITAPSNRLIRLVRIRKSQRTTAASQQVLVAAQRASAAGTSTAQTPTPFEVNAGAAGSTVGVNCTVEPTYTAGTVIGQDDANSLIGSDLYWTKMPTVPPSGIVGIFVTNPTGNAAESPDMVVEFEEEG